MDDDNLNLDNEDAMTRLELSQLLRDIALADADGTLTAPIHPSLQEFLGKRRKGGG